MRDSWTPLAEKLVIKASLVDTAQTVPVSCAAIMISNIGAQPLYFNPTTTATATNGIVVAAGTTFPVKFTVAGDLSIISNATGTTAAVLFFDN